MKIKFFIMCFFFSIISIGNIQTLESSKSRKQNYRPNLSDIKRYMKPILQGPDAPYIPKEVDTLNNYDVKSEDDSMLHAEIVGNQDNSTGVNEKPTLYDTVISTHKTSIKHPQDFAPQKGFTTGAGSMAAFGQTEIQRLGEGKLAIPVKLEMSSSLVKDPTLSQYETPSFLSTKSDRVDKEGQFLHVPKAPMLSPQMVATSAKDLKMIKSKLNLAKSKKEKLRALNFGKTKLKGEAKSVIESIKKEVGNVVRAKGIALKLDSIVQKYTLRLKQDELAKLKLVDRVEIKKQLKNKIFREVEGLRSTGKEYTELSKVNPSDMKKIVNEIKSRLGF